MGIFNINDKLTRYKINWNIYKEWMTTDYPKKFKLQTWREKKYRKTTNKMGRWFLGGRNRPRGLRLIVYDEKYSLLSSAMNLGLFRPRLRLHREAFWVLLVFKTSLCFESWCFPYSICDLASYFCISEICFRVISILS